MAFQGEVFRNQGVGVPGELVRSTPHVVLPYNLSSPNPEYNIPGRAFTLNLYTNDQIAAGQSGSGTDFRGILIGPKSYTFSGSVDTPNASIDNGTNVALCPQGHVSVYLPVPDLSGNVSIEIGDLIVFDIATGELGSIRPTDALPVGYAPAYAAVDIFRLDASGVAFAWVQKIPTIPVAA